MPVVQTPPAPPRGNWYISSTLATLQALAARVDASQGYPRAGVFAAPGPFQAATPFVTTAYQDVIAHPTQQLWAYPSDPVIDPVLVGTPGLPVPIALTQDWSGTQPIAAGTVQAPPPPAQPVTPNRIGLAAIAIAAAGIAAGVAMGVSSQPSSSPSIDAGADTAQEAPWESE